MQIAGLHPLPDYSDAILLPSAVVHGVNDEILANGAKKLAVLTDIRDFRRNLLYIAWERRYMTAALEDQREFYRDLQLLRSSGATGEYLKGVNVSAKARKDADKASERLAYMKVSHGRTLAKLGKAEAKLASAVADRRAEVRALDDKRRGLEEGVAVRESILRTRDAFVAAGAATSGAFGPPATTGSGGGGGGDTLGLGGTGALGAPSPAERMAAVATKSRLNAIAKAQASELETLRGELDKLRQKTFPCFPAAPPVPAAAAAPLAGSLGGATGSSSLRAGGTLRGTGTGGPVVPALSQSTTNAASKMAQGGAASLRR